MSALTEWFIYTSGWYVMLLAIGLIFFPITRTIFGRFYDYGYGFSKAVGIGLLSYIVFALGTTKLIPFTTTTLYILLALIAYLSFRLYKRNPLKKSARVSLIIFEEVLFALAFFTWAYIRSYEPSIRGLEKFMDFGFINSVLRGEYFPAQDMWLAGKSINYYYFGHITGAVLTKLSAIPSYISYNLILAQLFALSIAGTFTLGFNIAYHGFKRHLKLSFITGLLSSFIVNVAGNLHTMYAFTTGYPNEKPAPIWELSSKFTAADLSKPLEALDKLPIGYWYPNATRFIPYTIHEFPLYSYVVADLHGHVFDIPFVLITLGVLFSFFLHTKASGLTFKILSKLDFKHLKKHLKKDLSFETGYLGYTLLLGFLLSIHLMTNAFDAPIFLALTGIIFLSIFGLSQRLFIYSGTLFCAFFIFNIPFTIGFEPFASGVGFNCMPTAISDMIQGFVKGSSLESRLVFENNCQTSQWWMTLTLWGFFWFNFIALIVHGFSQKFKLTRVTTFVLTLFAFSTLLIVAPEFVYAKDIYPSHFRANTMFKLGYAAFIMMGVASAYTFTLFKKSLPSVKSFTYIILFLPLFGLIALYPTFAIESFYGSDKIPNLNGQSWLNDGKFDEYAGIIAYLNENVEGQPVILEAQGDSYTDYNVVSAYTGLPTVGGWYVHEWLWRGDPDAVGKLSPDIQTIYESPDEDQTRALLAKYNVQFVVIGSNEREKYGGLYESKFEALGKAVYRSQSQEGVIYEIPIDTY